MPEDNQLSEQAAWQPELVNEDLCARYGHQECGGHEVDSEANIIVCTCWCHHEEIAHT